jgi:hypothetical protein
VRRRVTTGIRRSAALGKTYNALGEGFVECRTWQSPHGKKKVLAKTTFEVQKEKNPKRIAKKNYRGGSHWPVQVAAFFA